MVKHGGRRAVGALGTIILLATGSVACSSAAEPSTTPPSTTTTAPSPTEATFQGDLRTLILALPATAAVTRGPQSPPDGLVDLERAATSSGVSTSRMKAAGFVKGAVGEWLDADQTWVGIFLDQFSSGRLASEWSSALRDSFKADDGFAAGVPIAGVPDGMVYARKAISVNGRWLTEAVFAKNGIAVDIFVTGPVHHDPQKTMDYAIAQFARLP